MWIRRDQVTLGVSEHRHRQAYAGPRFRLRNFTSEMARKSERCVRAPALQTNHGATGARGKSKLNNTEHGPRGVWFVSNTPLRVVSSYLNHSFYGAHQPIFGTEQRKNSNEFQRKHSPPRAFVDYRGLYVAL